MGFSKAVLIATGLSFMEFSVSEHELSCFFKLPSCQMDTVTVVLPQDATWYIC